VLSFYCAGGKFGEVVGVFLAENHSPELALVASDAEPMRLVYCQCLALLGLGIGCHAPDAG